MAIFITIGYILACVFLFALAILVHEFGHFAAALKLGLRVEVFSIGFGPALWKHVHNGVEYRLSAIPLGGYVSIPDIDPEGTKALEGGSTSSSVAEAMVVPAWKEILVAVAGPLMNIVLAVVIAISLAVVPGVRFGELPAKIGGVFEGGPAAKGGLMAGDIVKSVGGRAVDSWSEFMTEVQIAGNRETEFVVERKQVGGGVDSVTLTITPKSDEVTGSSYVLAYSETNATMAAMWMPSRNPLKQLIWDAGSIFRVLKGLVTPSEAKNTAKAVGGPVMIAQALYAQVRRNFADGIGFLRFLNVNLAVLNLLPIPVLDGGLVLFALIALVFRRRIPEKAVKVVSMAFMVLLMGLMAVLVFRDSVRAYKLRTLMHEEAVDVSEKSDAADQGR